MAKITKREYNKEKQELTIKLEKVQKELAEIEAKPYNEELGKRWDTLHDQEWELQQELKFLEDRWDKRNWTFSDYQQWELVSNNID